MRRTMPGDVCLCFHYVPEEETGKSNGGTARLIPEEWDLRGQQFKVIEHGLGHRCRPSVSLKNAQRRRDHRGGRFRRVRDPVREVHAGQGLELAHA